MRTIEVVAAIIIKNNEVLCMQRNKNKLEYISEKYEFPGGKVEIGEDRHVALMRELDEEMEIDLNISEEDYYLTVDHTYPDFRIIMHSYIAHVKEVDFVMNEHIGFKWLTRDRLKELDWAPADIPIVNKLSQEV